MEGKKNLLDNIKEIRTTEMGTDRIRRNQNHCEFVQLYDFHRT